MNDLKTKVAMVVISCDKYSDLWQPFFYLLKKFWPDCPFRIYLISNEKKFDDPGVSNILVGQDVSWSDNLINALKNIKENYIFLWVDDLFLIEKINTEKILALLNWAIELNANYLCLNGLPKPDQKYNNKVGLISAGSIYRTSVVLSFWEKKTLLALLRP